MKKLAYVLYVVSVLLISGLARANAATLADSTQAQYQAPVQISQISADASKLELLVAGSVPNPCFGKLSATLTQDNSSPNTLILHISSPIPVNVCVSQVKYFQTTIELPILAQASLLNLNDKALYLLKVDGIQQPPAKSRWNVVPAKAGWKLGLKALPA